MYIDRTHLLLIQCSYLIALIGIITLCPLPFVRLVSVNVSTDMNFTNMLTFGWNIRGLLLLTLNGCFRNETAVPVFYRGNKLWVRVRVRMNLKKHTIFYRINTILLVSFFVYRRQ